MAIVQPALDGSVPPAKVPAARRRVDDYETWVAEVRPTFVKVARTSRRWTSFEIAEEYELPEPPNPRSHWGSFVHRLVEDGLIEHVGYDETVRPGGEHSAVKVWKGTLSARNGRIS